MDGNTPITLAAASYRDRHGAVADFKSMRDARKAGEFDHTAVAMLTKDASGRLQGDNWLRHPGQGAGS